MTHSGSTSQATNPPAGAWIAGIAGHPARVRYRRSPRSQLAMGMLYFHRVATSTRAVSQPTRDRATRDDTCAHASCAALAPTIEDTFMASTVYRTADLPLRISSKIRPNEITGCWEWMPVPPTHPQYGQLWTGSGHNRKAHRVIYELLVGPVPTGMELDHLCRVIYCVNPAHLEVVTSLENNRRGNAVYRWVGGRRQPSKRFTAEPTAADYQLARHVMEILGDERRMWSHVIHEQLVARWPSLYGSWSAGKLHGPLRRLGIKPRQINIQSSGARPVNHRGYYRSDFVNLDAPGGAS